ncbi:MAG TPA: winged helix-turn-helix domain-containing protein [Candidatus Solibacter sp.]|jgi:WD40 repeat protein/DNA-binding winged helix-turn-helix (wHTH) protein|nr:winged helix-turn-helix domain-containing protein [Candidatus Solibacter sp.]
MHEKTLIYSFGEFRVDLGQRLLLRNGQAVAVTPKCFDTLVFLVENHGRLLQKEEMLTALWPESHVEERNLNQQVYALRRILGDDRNGNSFIQTVPRRGYKFVASVTRIENGAPGGAQSSPQADYWNRHTPFRSLQAFEPEDGWLFFGRGPETDELVERLGRCPILVVAGNSGCGKSSLLRAGLVPALLQGRFRHEGLPVESWRIAVFRPSGAPFDYLAEVLTSQLAPELSLKEQAEFIAECRSKFPFEKEALRNAVGALANVTAEGAKAGQTHVLLVADQFEEIFTLTGKRETRDRYINALLAAVQPGGAVSVHLVLALRADFYAQCLEHMELSRCLGTNLYNVPRMGREQLRESIERRLQLAAAQAEPGLIDSLLEEVGAEPGNLALLEHALGQLWDTCGGFGCTLANRAYAEIGRLRGALGRHADAVYTSLGDDRVKRLAQKIFLELVHLGEDDNAGNVTDTRRRAAKMALISLGGAEEVEQLLARLVASRLIATGGSEQETFVEVSHEALIREWPALREWIAVHRDSLRLERRLRQAADEWEIVKRDPGALLQGARLAQGEEWLARSPEAPSLLQEFLQAGLAARDEAARKALAAQKKAALHLRWFSCALALLLLAAMGTVWYTYRLQLIEKSRALAAQAEEMRGRDQGQALGLAIRGWRTAKTDEARLAVTKAFPQLVATLNHAAGVESAVFSSDGQRILTASDDHTARLWSSKDGRLLATLVGHTDKILYAEFSPDGQRIVTASFDHTARVWSAADGRLLVSLQGHTDKVEDARFSPDGGRIVTASWDHTARVWSSADGRLLGTLQGHTDYLYRAIFSPDGQRIVTGSQDHTARVWSGLDYALLATLAGHSEAVVDAGFSPDGRRIVTCAWDHTARVWSSADGRLLAVLQHDGGVRRATFSPDSRRIATGSVDHTARVWDSEHGRLLVTLQGHTSAVWHITFSPDGRLILTDSDDSTARVWNSVNGRLLATLQVPAGTSFAPGDSNALPWFSAFSPDGRLVVAALGDPAARIWDIGASGDMMALLRGHTITVMGAIFSPHGERIITRSADHTARVWNSVDGRLLATIKHTAPVLAAQFSPDGQRVVTASDKDRVARVWNSADGRLLATLEGSMDVVWQAQFSPDGQRIVTSSKDHTARVWNSADGRLLATIKHTAQVWAAQFSPDGQRIVTAYSDRTARVWDSTDGHLLTTLEGHADTVLSAQFSPDGQRIVTASKDHTARVWSSADGHLVITLEGHTDSISSAQFSPDGQRIVTASKNTAWVWSSADGRLLTTLEGHKDVIWRTQFSPDGRRIVTASSDHTARLWDSSAGRLLATLQGHTQLIQDVAFSPHGQRIVTASADQTARVWRLLTLGDIEQILAK